MKATCKDTRIGCWLSFNGLRHQGNITPSQLYTNFATGAHVINHLMMMRAPIGEIASREKCQSSASLAAHNCLQKLSAFCRETRRTCKESRVGHGDYCQAHATTILRICYFLRCSDSMYILSVFSLASYHTKLLSGLKLIGKSWSSAFTIPSVVARKLAR